MGSKSGSGSAGRSSSGVAGGGSRSPITLPSSTVAGTVRVVGSTTYVSLPDKSEWEIRARMKSNSSAGVDARPIAGPAEKKSPRLRFDSVEDAIRWTRGDKSVRARGFYSSAGEYTAYQKPD